MLTSRTTRRRIGGVLLTGLAVAGVLCAGGCGGGHSVASGQPAVSTQANGWKVYRPKTGSYQVSLPGSWQTVDAGSLFDSDRMAELENGNPDLKKLVNEPQVQQLLRRPDTLIALEGEGHGTHAMIMRLPMGQVPDLPARVILREIAKAYRAGLAETPIEGLIQSETTLAGRPAMSFEYRGAAPHLGGAPQTIYLHDVLVQRGDSAWVLQTASGAAAAPDAEPTFQRIRDSFTLR